MGNGTQKKGTKAGSMTFCQVGIQTRVTNMHLGSYSDVGARTLKTPEPSCVRDGPWQQIF